MFLKNSDILTEIFLSVVEESGYSPYFGYLGRGMFGEECFGITGSIRNLGKLFNYLHRDLQDSISAGLCSDESNVENFLESLEVLETDSLGLDQIIYFRKLIIEESE